MKNIVFDLGGVVFARNPKRCPAELLEFFSFIAAPEMPSFWKEYDRGTLTAEQVVEALCEYRNCLPEQAWRYIRMAIDLQEEIPSTRLLLQELKTAGYRLYVLSNMSRDFIDFLRGSTVYSMFDGEVISCDEGVVKPEREIFEILLSRFDILPTETLFIDDRKANVEAAEHLGISAFLFDPQNPETSCESLRRMLL